jgi:hypothetical protein
MIEHTEVISNMEKGIDPRKMNMNYQMEIRIIWNPKFHPVLYIDIYICTSLTKYINIEDRSLLRIELCILQFEYS